MKELLDDFMLEETFPDVEMEYQFAAEEEDWEYDEEVKWKKELIYDFERFSRINLIKEVFLFTDEDVCMSYCYCDSVDPMPLVCASTF